MARVPRTKLTFAVVDDQHRRRSLVWRFEIGGSDVYFSPSRLFDVPEPGRYHISLHSDGRCHHTFEGQFFANGAARRIGLTDPRTKKWRRPATPTDGPGVVVYSVGVLPDDPIAVPPDRVNEIFDMTMPPAEPGFITELQIFYSNVPPSRFTAPGGTILRHHTLANGEIIYFIGFQGPFDTRSLSLPASSTPRGDAIWLGPETTPKLPPDFRGVLFCSPSPHHHMALDVSVAVDPEDPRHLQFLLVTSPSGGQAKPLAI